jgi:hypothetical protein
LEDYLVLKFNLIHFKGKDYTVEAYALDPNTTLAGMATEVDHRYLVRVVLPAAASFLNGLGSALSQTQQEVVSSTTATIVTQSKKGFKDGMYQGFGEAAKTAGEFFQNQANTTKTLVRIASGTPMGIFFTQTVFDTQTGTTQSQYPYIVQNYPGTPTGAVPAGYSGGAIPGYSGQQQYPANYGAYGVPYGPNNTQQNLPYNPSAYATQNNNNSSFLQQNYAPPPNTGR